MNLVLTKTEIWARTSRQHAFETLEELLQLQLSYQANAEAETFMKPLKKHLQIAVIGNKIPIYHVTPHCTTKVPPATALFGQNIGTK